MPDDVSDTNMPLGLPCVRCSYDLSGLNEGGVCPECSHPIRDSILRRKRPWPTWLRYVRTIYCAAWTTIIATPFALPPIGRALGLPVITGRRAAYGDVLVMCIVPTALLGLVLAGALGRRNHWLTYFVAASLVLLGLWVLPALGH